MQRKGICCIFLFGSHYRTSIYRLLGEELNCDIYLGDVVPEGIKGLDIKEIIGFKGYLRNIWLFGNYYWQFGAVLLVFKPYKKIILTGDPHCISNWIILFLARLLHKKTYLWTHGWYGRESAIKNVIKKAFFNIGYHTLVYGEYAKELMVNQGFSPQKVSCIYNSLDYDKQIALRKVLKPTLIFQDHFSNNSTNLIFIGRLTSGKRLDLLFKALAKLNESSSYYNLTLIGDGEKREELISLSNLLKLDNNTWFFGESYDEDEVAELLFNADICVSPGNVGLTALHAMGYGTPVITHNNYPYQGPEFESINEGQTGAFFEYDNYISLAETINKLFKITLKRDEIRKNCYKVIDSKYNPHYQISVLKKLILDY